MRNIADSSPAVAPSLAAGLLLAARELQAQLGLSAPGAAEILEKTGAGRSAAYEAKARILEVLPSLRRPVGRPPEPKAPAPSGTDELCHAVLRFVMAHPGCVQAGPGRRGYSPSFRRMILDLHERHPEMGPEELARAAEVPLDTLRGWMRVGMPPEASLPETVPPVESPKSLRIQTVLAEWKQWDGAFVPFCKHLQENHRIPLGRTAIAGILEAHGVRLGRKRSGRSPDEKALRDSFERFFPGAQWVGDGTPVNVDVFGERFTFNLELVVDAETGAFVGVSLRDAEDAAAVVEAIEDGKATTGEAPLSVLLDNRPSNLAPEVQEALDETGTLLIRASPGRGQNKAHCEGAFGLFRQMVPALVLAAASAHEVARELLRLVVITWARTLNHRPRVDRGGRSRVEDYSEKPEPEAVEKARIALAERFRRQEASRQTLQARQNPIVRQTIAEAYERLGIADPDGHQLDATARYPLSAVLDGIATFEGKQAAGTLPPNLDLPGRYLLGIIRNLSGEREGLLISEAMLRARLDARDALLEPLVEQRRLVGSECPTPLDAVARLVGLALEAERYIDRLFWLSAVGEVIGAERRPGMEALYRAAIRRINAASWMRKGERLAAARIIANTALPVD